MSDLIIRRGMDKKAAPEDGPSFEQQFGILANANITEKFPQLDRMKLAFQLIEKSEDNQDACGAMVYLLGKSVVFVPAFFKNQKLRTGDMMFIAQTQQFLPLADPWLAWVRDKDLASVGDRVDSQNGDDATSANTALAREYLDPITKTASAYLRALLHVDPDFEKKAADASLLDTALSLGKKATGALCDQLTGNVDFLNSTLAFYTGDELNDFCKKAAAKYAEAPAPELVLPFSKQARELDAESNGMLAENGWFVKNASKDVPTVIRKPQVRSMFSALSEPGKASLLGMDGTLNDALVLNRIGVTANGKQDRVEDLCTYSRYESGASVEASTKYMGNGGSTFVTVAEEGIGMLPAGAMEERSGHKEFKPYMIVDKGVALSSCDEIAYCDVLLYPDGTASEGIGGKYIKTGDNVWCSDWDTSLQAVKGTNRTQTSPIVSGGRIILPADTRVIKCVEDEDGRKTMKQHSVCQPVTLETLEAFLTEFSKKKYNKAKVYSDGISVSVSGDKTASARMTDIPEAALQLVRDYGVSNELAREMLKGASANHGEPAVEEFYIEKTASDPMWQDSNIPMGEHQNRPPQTEYMEMPAENPEKLQQAVQSAAQQGIKEVFDVTALKVLVRQSRFFDEIAEDMPLFMRTLDSLCRKLFQFYWHTDKMEEKYGMSKLKSLEESLKGTIDSLSDLTIFFKLRTVDGTGSVGDTTSELMGGQML